MGDIGGLFESLLLIASVIIKIFGTNLLDLYIIQNSFKTSSLQKMTKKRQPKFPKNNEEPGIVFE